MKITTFILAVLSLFLFIQCDEDSNAYTSSQEKYKTMTTITLHHYIYDEKGKQQIVITVPMGSAASHLLHGDQIKFIGDDYASHEIVSKE